MALEQNTISHTETWWVPVSAEDLQFDTCSLELLGFAHANE